MPNQNSKLNNPPQLISKQQAGDELVELQQQLSKDDAELAKINELQKLNIDLETEGEAEKAVKIKAIALAKEIGESREEVLATGKFTQGEIDEVFGEEKEEEVATVASSSEEANPGEETESEEDLVLFMEMIKQMKENQTRIDGIKERLTKLREESAEEILDGEATARLKGTNDDLKKLIPEVSSEPGVEKEKNTVPQNLNQEYIEFEEVNKNNTSPEKEAPEPAYEKKVFAKAASTRGFGEMDTKQKQNGENIFEILIQPGGTKAFFGISKDASVQKYMTLMGNADYYINSNSVKNPTEVSYSNEQGIRDGKKHIITSSYGELELIDGDWKVIKPVEIQVVAN